MQQSQIFAQQVAKVKHLSPSTMKQIKVGFLGRGNPSMYGYTQTRDTMPSDWDIKEEAI